MFDVNNVQVNNLTDLLMTNDYNKKIAMYGGIAVYLLNNMSIFKSNPSLEGDRFEAMYKVEIKNFAYALNNISVIDIDTLLLVINKFIAVKKGMLKVEDGLIRESESISDIFGIQNVFGNILINMNDNFSYFRKVHNALVRIQPLSGDNNEAVEG